MMPESSHQQAALKYCTCQMKGDLERVEKYSL